MPNSFDPEEIGKLTHEVDQEWEHEFKTIMTEGFVDLMAQTYKGAMLVASNTALRTVAKRHGLTLKQLRGLYAESDQPTKRH